MELLHKFRVPIGGDQLTRAGFHEAKLLRSLSPDPAKRFADLDPMVVEMWHMKQDLLKVTILHLFLKYCFYDS